MESNLLITKSGDICDATEEYIMQQCCCTAVRPHGLSETIANRFNDANPYALRRAIGRRNMAVKEDRPNLGTIIVLGKRKVVCAFAMGKPGKYDSCGLSDNSEDRLRYFKMCLQK